MASRSCWMGLTHCSDRLGRVPLISRWFADGVGLPEVLEAVWAAGLAHCFSR